jgi:hypothetical protein
MALYTFRGRAQSLPKWAAELGIPESTPRSRLGKLGQPVEEAFSRPLMLNHERYAEEVTKGLHDTKKTEPTKSG